jgi:SRSO17 transposase
MGRSSTHAVRSDDAVAQVKGWTAQLEALGARIGPRFARAEPRRRALAYVQGLLGEVERKNGWQLAEHAGEATPDGMQRLLATARWDPDQLRDDLRAFVIERLGDPGAVLVVDETGFIKKGTTSVGVQRQYTGTSGKVDNCQLGVFLAYAAPAGHAFIDRALYLPRSWTDDPGRCQAAGVPTEVGFATKAQLARELLPRALDAKVPAAWVTADEVYGQDPGLRAWLQDRRQPYVLAIKRSERLEVGGATAEQLLGRVPADRWLRLSAGDGAKGRRLYDWTRIPLAATSPAGMTRWLLVRRSLRDPDELAFYTCAGPAGTPLTQLVTIAGTRWSIEVGFQTAKGEVGLTTTRSAAGRAGIAISPWRCWPTPSSRSCAPGRPMGKGGRAGDRGRRAAGADRAGDPAATGPALAHPAA